MLFEVTMIDLFNWTDGAFFLENDIAFYYPPGKKNIYFKQVTQKLQISPVAAISFCEVRDLRGCYVSKNQTEVWNLKQNRF